MKGKPLNTCPYCEAAGVRSVDSRRKSVSCRKRRYRCFKCDKRWNSYEIITGIPGAMALPRELMTQFKQQLFLTPTAHKALALERATNEELLTELLAREKNK